LCRTERWCFFFHFPGLSVDAAAGSSFEKEAMGAILDFTADDAEGLRAQKNSKKWDMKKKKFVGASGNVSIVSFLPR
jgi:hypothetical protein